MVSKCYDFIYKLRPVKEYEEDWYKLGWMPIKGSTWNLYSNKLFARSDVMGRAIGFHIMFGGAHNGWGRYWDRMDIRLSVWFRQIDFWIIWKIKVHKDGPTDLPDERKPLDLSGLKK